METPTLDRTPDEIEIEQQENALVVSFKHETNDDRFDRIVRALHDGGGKILAFENERATLLEVLESYEREHEAEEES